MPDHFLSPAQLLGYLAFVFGVGCFVQTDDRRFKTFMALECLSYVLHFWLLGQPTAVASNLSRWAARWPRCAAVRPGWRCSSSA